MKTILEAVAPLAATLVEDVTPVPPTPATNVVFMALVVPPTSKPPVSGLTLELPPGDIGVESPI